MKDRFDLENEIMGCWHIVDDIKALYEGIVDSPQPLTEDNITNILIGLEQLYNLKFDKLWHTFEECISNNVFEQPRTRHAIFSNGDLNEQSTTREVQESDDEQSDNIRRDRPAIFSN